MPKPPKTCTARPPSPFARATHARAPSVDFTQQTQTHTVDKQQQRAHLRAVLPHDARAQGARDAGAPRGVRREDRRGEPVPAHNRKKINKKINKNKQSAAATLLRLLLLFNNELIPFFSRCCLVVPSKCVQYCAVVINVCVFRTALLLSLIGVCVRVDNKN